MAAVTTTKWAPQGRRSKAQFQTVGLNAEKKKIGIEPKGSTFHLTFSFIGLVRFAR
jgi:hypothetical protein